MNKAALGGNTAAKIHYLMRDMCCHNCSTYEDEFKKMFQREILTAQGSWDLKLLASFTNFMEKYGVFMDFKKIQIAEALKYKNFDEFVVWKNETYDMSPSKTIVEHKPPEAVVEKFIVGEVLPSSESSPSILNPVTLVEKESVHTSPVEKESDVSGKKKRKKKKKKKATAQKAPEEGSLHSSDSPSSEKDMSLFEEEKQKPQPKSQPKKPRPCFTEEELEQKRLEMSAQYDREEKEQKEIRGIINFGKNMSTMSKPIEKPSEKKEKIRPVIEIEKSYPWLKKVPENMNDLQTKYSGLLKIKVNESDDLGRLNSSLSNKEDGYQKIEGALLTIIEEYISKRGFLTKAQEEQYSYIINVSKILPTPIREFLKGTDSGNIAFTITGENRLTCSFRYPEGTEKLPTITIHCFGIHYKG